MLLFINELWQEAGTFEKAYWAMALPFSFGLLIILISTFLGGDADGGGVDAEIEADTGAGVQFFTLKNLVGFFTIMGWTGIACIKMELSGTATVIISLTAGLAMMAAMAYLFYGMSKLVQDGTLKMERAIGRTGSVYMRIPAQRSGMGKVQITVQGSLRELDALTDHDTDIATGTMVRVSDLVDGHMLLVAPLPISSSK
ncbi:MAG: hypothetical protein KF905_14610 [Flavobacteriales bacterium]|nr:hypothetical protein [Flavobacteriales bacterium]